MTLIDGLLESPWSTFYSHKTELFSLSITVPELWGGMYTAQLFSQGVDLFALKFYLEGVVSHQPFLASEN